jgi:hypothetical protein
MSAEEVQYVSPSAGMADVADTRTTANTAIMPVEEEAYRHAEGFAAVLSLRADEILRSRLLSRLLRLPHKVYVRGKEVYCSDGHSRNW